jgi:hypothetical protein
MPVLTIKSFGGIAPKVPPRYLQESQAQVATNCPVFNGSLQALSDTSASILTLPKTGVPKTIYRFGQETISDTEFWFHWTDDVDVVRSQIAGDTSEWTFFTGDGPPKATYAALALTGNNYPAASRPLGLPAPPTAAIANVLGNPDPTAVAETRVYTHTWVNKESGFEFESAPAPASNQVNVRTGQTVELSGLSAVPGGDFLVSHRRIYRSVSGIFLFVAEIAATSTLFIDDVAPEALGEPLPSLFWAQPPDDLKGIINMPNGIVSGYVGRDVYFSEPYRPFAWPQTYIQTVDYPIVGLGRMDTTLAVLTTGVPYFIQGSHPDSMAVVKSDLEQACVSKRSIVSSGSAVYYAAPDGLMMLSPGGSRIVTQNLFSYKQWQSFFRPESIHAYQHDNQYIAFYDNGTTQGGFIYDMTSGQFILHDIYATAGYRDRLRDKLFLAFANRNLRVWGEGAERPYIWRSKKFTLPQIAGFACAQVSAEDYPVTLKVYADDALIHTQTVTSRNAFRLPAKVGRDWEVQVEGSKEVFAVSLAGGMTELASV